MIDPVVRMKHVRAQGLCLRGVRDWCSRNSINYSLFLAEGIPASTLEATGDPLALKVAASARAESEE